MCRRRSDHQTLRVADALRWRVALLGTFEDAVAADGDHSGLATRSGIHVDTRRRFRTAVPIIGYAVIIRIRLAQGAAGRKHGLTGSSVRTPIHVVHDPVAIGVELT
jgi:hypothetical protein